MSERRRRGKRGGKRTHRTNALSDAIAGRCYAAAYPGEEVNVKLNAALASELRAAARHLDDPSPERMRMFALARDIEALCRRGVASAPAVMVDDEELLFWVPSPRPDGQTGPVFVEDPWDDFKVFCPMLDRSAPVAVPLRFLGLPVLPFTEDDLLDERTAQQHIYWPALRMQSQLTETPLPGRTEAAVWKKALPVSRAALQLAEQVSARGVLTSADLIDLDDHGVRLIIEIRAGENGRVEESLMPDRDVVDRCLACGPSELPAQISATARYAVIACRSTSDRFTTAAFASSSLAWAAAHAIRDAALSRFPDPDMPNICTVDGPLAYTTGRHAA